MKGLVPLFIGLFGTFAFSWVGLTVIPNFQIGHLEPQSDEDATDIYPMPQSGMVERGRQVYVGNGCIYCHSQQIRADYAGADIDRSRDAGPSPRPKWADRRSAPRDYIFERPVQLGKERMGPDLANIGKAASIEQQPPAAPPAGAPAATPATPAASPAAAAPNAPAPAAPNASPAAAVATPANPNSEPLPYSEAWHHKHLYAPRSISPDLRDSNMPAYKFLYEKQLIGAEPSADALKLNGPDAPPPGWEVVPTYDAKCLVAYLMSRDQSHPLKEVKSSAPPAASPAAAAAPAKGTK